MNIGINLAGNTDYGTSRMWINLKNQLRSWGDKLSYDSAMTTVDVNGSPLRDCYGFSVLNNYPDGTYNYSFEGDGTITFLYGSNSQTTQKSGNITSGTVNILGSSQNFGFKFTGVNPLNPPKNLKILVPGYPLDTTQIFHPDFLAMVAPFSVIRSMDLANMNQSHTAKWSDRTPTNGLQTLSRGISWEYIIALANATKKDLWINIPENATVDFITGLANLCATQLNSTLNVYVEIGNENWNFMFQGASSIYNTLAPACTDLLSTDAYVRCYEYVGWQFKRTLDIFRTAMGTTRVRGVFAGQAANAWWLENGLSFLENKYGAGTCASLVWGLSYADYFMPNPVWDIAGATLDGFFKSLTDSITKDNLGYLTTHKALATKYGVKNIATYEGGIGVIDGTTINSVYIKDWNHVVKRAAQDDPRMGDAYRLALSQFFNNGGTLWNQFTSIGAYGSGEWGYWGMSENIDSPSIKWTTIKSLTGTATTVPPQPPAAYPAKISIEQGANKTVVYLQQSPPPKFVLYNNDGSSRVLK